MTEQTISKLCGRLPCSLSKVLNRFPDVSNFTLDKNPPRLFLGHRTTSIKACPIVEVFAYLASGPNADTPPVHIYYEQEIDGKRKKWRRPASSMLRLGNDLKKPFRYLGHAGNPHHIRQKLGAVVLYYMAWGGVSDAAFHWEDFRVEFKAALEYMSQYKHPIQRNPAIEELDSPPTSSMSETSLESVAENNGSENRILPSIENHDGDSDIIMKDVKDALDPRAMLPGVISEGPIRFESHGISGAGDGKKKNRSRATIPPMGVAAGSSTVEFEDRMTMCSVGDDKSD